MSLLTSAPAGRLPSSPSSVQPLCASADDAGLPSYRSQAQRTRPLPTVAAFHWHVIRSASLPSSTLAILFSYLCAFQFTLTGSQKASPPPPSRGSHSEPTFNVFVSCVLPAFLYAAAL